jgi:hypothetical protein
LISILIPLLRINFHYKNCADVAKLEENIKLMDNVLETLTIPSNPQDDELEMLNKVIDGASDLLSLVNDTASVLVKVASVLVPKVCTISLNFKETSKILHI